MTTTVHQANEHGQSGDAHFRPIAEDDLAALEIVDKEVFKDMAFSMVYLKPRYVLSHRT